MTKKIIVNGLYKHFKGHVYQVIALGKDSESLEEKVVYQNVETNEIWIRSKEDFLREVDHKKYPNVEQQYRFELIEDSRN